tara:strand:- start:213 stop:2828 length:2616 start_codon:yes stop_codon:yes gene_type:complete
MATFYVDYEGSAGSGDGSSFANRASKIQDISYSGGDTIRIKKSPDPTSLGTGKVKRTQPHAGYNQRNIASGKINFSTTEGESAITDLSSASYQGFEDGDVLHFHKNTSSAGENLNGLYELEVTDPHNVNGNGTIKFKKFTSTQNSGTASTHYYYASSSFSIILNTDNITKSIACRDAMRDAFTAVSGVTTSSCVHTTTSFSSDVDWTLGTGSDRFQIPSSQSTGKVAHFQLPSTLDLSGYQQISMMVRRKNYSNSDALCSIRLCTDTAGDTSVHTIPIKLFKGRPDSFIPVVVDLGTNLNSSINSIALYLDTAGTTVDLYISNIVACKASSSADSLTHQSLVGLNTTADFVWYPVMAIWDNIILLRVGPPNNSNGGYYSGVYGYFSASNDNATIYKREPISIAGRSSGIPIYSSHIFDKVDNNKDGTEGSPTIISAGWDDTNMSTQNGKTFLYGNGYGRVLRIYADYVNVENFYASYFYDHIYATSVNNLSLNNVGGSVCYYAIFYFEYVTFKKLNIDFAFGIQSHMLYLRYCTQNTTDSDYANDFNLKYLQGSSESHTFYPQYNYGEWKWGIIRTEGMGSGFRTWSQSETWTINYLYAGNTFSSYALYVNQNIHIKNLIYSGSNHGAYVSSGQTLIVDDIEHTEIGLNPSTSNLNGSRQGRRYGRSCGGTSCMQINPAANVIIKDGVVGKKFYMYGGTVKAQGLEILESTDGTWNTDNGGKILMRDYDNQSGVFRNSFYRGTLEPETSVRHTASGYAWKFTFNSTNTSVIPIDLGKIIVNNGSLVTIGLWTYKTAADKYITLKIVNNPQLGMTADITANNTSASNNTWTKIEVTFTPSAQGPAEIQVIGQSTGVSSSTYCYFDDLEVAQA